MSLPVVKTPPDSAGNAPPTPPSGNFVDYQVDGLALKVPQNWNRYEDSGSVTFAPDGGISQKGGLAYGKIVSGNQVQNDGREQGPGHATQAPVREPAKPPPGLKAPPD